MPSLICITEWNVKDSTGKQDGICRLVEHASTLVDCCAISSFLYVFYEYAYRHLAEVHLVNCVLSMFLRRYHRLGMATVDQVVWSLAKQSSVFRVLFVASLVCGPLFVVQCNVFSVAMCIFNHVIHAIVLSANTCNYLLTFAQRVLVYLVACVSLLVALCPNLFQTLRYGTYATAECTTPRPTDAYRMGQEYRMRRDTSFWCWNYKGKTNLFYINIQQYHMKIIIEFNENTMRARRKTTQKNTTKHT